MRVRPESRKFQSAVRARLRQPTGISIVEFAAALALGLPLIVAMIYTVLEANFLFTIRTNLDVANRRAAQVLINDYKSYGTLAANTSNGNLPSSPRNLQFDVKTADGHYFVKHDANQFSWTWDLSSSPNTLTVVVSYPSNGNGSDQLVPFPHPDPLHIKGKFVIFTSSTFSVPS